MNAFSIGISAHRTPAEHSYASAGSSVSLGVRRFGLMTGLGGTPGDWLPSLVDTRNEGVRGSNPRVGFSESLANAGLSFSKEATDGEELPLLAVEPV